jgi:hypothetical protein
MTDDSGYDSDKCEMQFADETDSSSSSGCPVIIGLGPAEHVPGPQSPHPMRAPMSNAYHTNDILTKGMKIRHEVMEVSKDVQFFLVPSLTAENVFVPPAFMMQDTARLFGETLAVIARVQFTTPIAFDFGRENYRIIEISNTLRLALLGRLSPEAIKLEDLMDDLRLINEGLFEKITGFLEGTEELRALTNYRSSGKPASRRDVMDYVQRNTPCRSECYLTRGYLTGLRHGRHVTRVHPGEHRSRVSHEVARVGH